nr:hypothetical protein [Tanacetum cinerariifolium]
MISRISFHVLYGRPFKTLCFFNYALMIRQDYDITSSLRRGALLEQSKSVHDTYPIEQDAQNVIIDSLDMNYDREEIDQNDDDNDLAKERELLASLIERLKCEIDESKNRNKFLETSNKVLIEKLKGEIEDFKTKNKSLESSNNFFKEANNKLSETNNLLYTDYKKSEAELARRNNKPFAHQETISILSKQKEAQIKLYKTREDKELDKVIELENKVKDLKAQLQDKDIVISELKKLIEKLKGKSVDTKFEKSSVIRQPNAFKSQRPSVLGKPTTFSNSFETVASESNKNPRNFTRKLYERVSKTCSWWYPKFTPLGYKWKPKSGKQNVNPNVSMPLGNVSRTANVMDTMTSRCTRSCCESGLVAEPSKAPLSPDYVPASPVYPPASPAYHPGLDTESEPFEAESEESSEDDASKATDPLHAQIHEEDNPPLAYFVTSHSSSHYLMECCTPTIIIRVVIIIIIRATHKRCRSPITSLPATALALAALSSIPAERLPPRKRLDDHSEMVREMYEHLLDIPLTRLETTKHELETLRVRVVSYVREISSLHARARAAELHDESS